MNPMNPKPVAVVCSDLHFSHHPPVARSAEESWYDSMQRTWKQVMGLADRYNVPVIIAGDLFDRWNVPPELINFALELFRSDHRMFYAIPGQHDLPHHAYRKIRKSAYWSLVSSGRIINLLPGQVCPLWSFEKGGHEDVNLYGFPYGLKGDLVERIQSADLRKNDCNVAVLHTYIWKGKASAHHGASRTDKASRWSRLLRRIGFDLAIAGDNHIGFEHRPSPDKGCPIFNCGTLMRRTAKEIRYQPRVGLLFIDGEGRIGVRRHDLDCSEDRFLLDEHNNESGTGTVLQGMQEFLDELESVSESSLDFAESVRHVLRWQEVGDETKLLTEDALAQ